LPSRCGLSEIQGSCSGRRTIPEQLEIQGSLNRLCAITEFIRSIPPTSGATMAERFAVVLRRRTIERASPAST
jgi:hypothetical protein